MEFGCTASVSIWIWTNLSFRRSSKWHSSMYDEWRLINESYENSTGKLTHVSVPIRLFCWQSTLDALLIANENNLRQDADLLNFTFSFRGTWNPKILVWGAVKIFMFFGIVSAHWKILLMTSSILPRNCWTYFFVLQLICEKYKNILK